MGDDKQMVIVAVTVIVICGMYAVTAEEVISVITHGITALGSLAVGRALK